MSDSDKALRHLINGLNNAVAVRDWASVESSAHRLRLWHIEREREMHATAAAKVPPKTEKPAEKPAEEKPVEQPPAQPSWRAPY